MAQTRGPPFDPRIVRLEPSHGGYTGRGGLSTALEKRCSGSLRSLVGWARFVFATTTYLVSPLRYQCSYLRCRYPKRLCSAARVAVSPTSAMASTWKGDDGLDSIICRLGGKAHRTGHARPVSAGVGRGAKSPASGTRATSQYRGLLIRRSFSLGDSSPFFFRCGVVKARRIARTAKLESLVCKTKR